MMESNTEAADSEEIDLIPDLALDQEENTVNSDRDSAESDVDERGEKIDSSPVKPTFKSILQAKKRLQAYSFAKVAKKPTKDEKNDEAEKSDKNTSKKPRKSQPLDRAKAVMEEIEEIKRQELRDEMVKQELIAATVKLIEANRRSRSRSSSPDRDRQFKRREIKSRNYRRTDSSGRKSASPEDRRRSSRRSQPGPVYPKNWTEYQQKNMTVRKDIELKAKLFPEKKLRHYEAFKKCHNFSTPSPIIESFKYSTLNSDMKETPRCFLRYTKACPNIPYNVNFKTIKESCISRPQLFSIIPYDRRQTLEKFFSLSRPQATSKKLKTREWYSKSWKSKTDADCKILENSVGLSFLQNYSDQEDEENETEEIVICSSTQSKSERAERAPSEEPVVSVDISSPTMSQSQTYSPIFEEVKERSTSPVASVDEVMSPNIVEDKTEFDSLSYSSQIEEKTSERFSPDMIVKEMEFVEDCDVDNKNSSGNFTPDNTDFHNKNRDEFEETKFAIEAEELELPKRPEDVKEKSIKTKKKKKDKKADKADNMAEKSTKSKRKRKVKRKRSTSTSEESVSSSDKDKKRKKSKKGKLKKKTAKKSPVKKKRKNKKENKVKRKKVDSDKESDEKPKKKRKRADSSSESDEKKHSTKNPKKSKKKKKSARDSESNEEVQRNCLIEDKKDDNEWEDIEEIDQNRDKPPSSKKTKNNYIIPVIEIDNLEENLRTSNETKSFEIELNIDKKYLQRTKSINEPQEKSEPTLSDNILCLPKTIDVKKEPEWEYTPDRSDNFVEDEEPNVNKLPTFNSWESDDEEFETRKTEVAETAVLTKSSSEELDFEMPLNIKPFKKRDVADYDIFKESNKEVRQTEEISEIELGDESPIIEQCEVPKQTKRGRWDRRDSVQKTPMVKPLANLEPEVTTKEVITTINPIKTAVLENEYEEFMKALTVTESNDSTKNSSNSSSAVGFADTDIKNFKTDLSTLVKDEKTSDTLLILPKDVPLIPIPAEVKPIPVPSPKVKIEDTTLPLIDIPPSPKLAVDPNLTVKASIDLVSPKKEKNRLNTEQSRKISVDNLVSSTGAENQYLQDLASISLPPCEDVPVEAKSAIPSDDVSSASEAVPEKKDKPFAFVGMTLSSKRVLLDKSKVNLDDSDDEDIKTKSLLKLQELESVVGTDVKEEKSLEPSLKDGTSLKQISPKDQHCEQTEQIKSESKPVRETILRRSSSPKQGRHSPPRNRRGSPPHRRRDVSPRRYGSPRRRTPDRRYSSKSNTSPRRKREYSPRKRSVSPRRRSISPRRRSVSPRRRGGSPPRRKRSTSPRRRGSPSRRRSVTPKRRQEAPRKRIVLSPRRSVSPRERRSMSPRRKRIHSPRERMDMSPSGKRRRSKSPDHFSHSDSNRPKSPPPIASPLQGPKRSVADSTISDDLLPQPNSNFEDHSDSPVSSFHHHHHHRPSKSLGSPKRLPLDSRLNEVLGLKPEPKTPVSSTYNAYAYQQEQYQQSTANSNVYDGGMPKSKGTFVQVGNMVQIVPSELPIKMDIPTPQVPTRQTQNVRIPTSDSVHHEKSKIVQVGNMLQIVPTTLPAQVIASTMPEIKKEFVPEEEEKVVCDKSPIEIPIKLKTAESRAEKEKRRKERELRRAEKERKRKEREKKKQVKFKQRTEDMIKRALQLEVDEQEEEEAFNETPMQWPPLSVTPSTSKEVGKSILVQAGVRRDSNKVDKRKIVQFADGVKPGEGTSPSGGEELMSPPPSKKLPKEKRYKKTKLFKTQKKKVKVKIIKKLPKMEDSDEEDDDLPPPSPPPGSPPPHIFPPRVKLHALNNVRQFLPNLVPLGHQTQQQPQQVTFTPPPPINLLMGHPSAIHQPPLPLPSSSAMVVGAHHVPITSVPPPIHHGAQAAAVPALLHHGSVPAVVPPMHQATVAMHHGLPHHTGPLPTGTHGLSHPHAGFHF